jgi:Ca2+-binding EF-hand superfamily protein
MDWLNRMTKISNKFKFQLFGRTVDDLERCYESASKMDSNQTGRMSEISFNDFLNSFGVFLSTQELRAIADHYKEADERSNHNII